MEKIREIKFRDRGGDLVGRQNGMMFIIRTEPGTPACAPAHWVTVAPGGGAPNFSTIGNQYFHLDEAKEFCRRIAAGEITLEDLQAAEGEQGTAGDSERELLIREYERRLERLKSGASPCDVILKNDRIELEPGMIVPLQDEERNGNGICNDFNVYLNGKGPDGKLLSNIKEVILPKIYARENGKIDPMDMMLVFGGCEDAAEIVALLGKKCKLEVRAAVERWNQAGQVEFHGHSYILEAVPLEIETDTVKGWAGLGLTIGFLVYRYTATVGDMQLWDFEWKEQERKR